MPGSRLLTTAVTALVAACALALGGPGAALAQTTSKPAPTKPAATNPSTTKKKSIGQTSKPSSTKPSSTKKGPAATPAKKPPAKPVPPPPPPPPPPVELIGYVTMPAAAFRGGPPSGQFDNDGRRAADPRFESQPVQGVSS